MKVILGCDPLLQPLTGIGIYTKQLASQLMNNQDDMTLSLFAHGKFYSNELVTKVKADNDMVDEPSIFFYLRKFAASSRLIVAMYQRSYPLISKFLLRNYSQYIFHSPNFVLPSFSGKKVVTIHDLSTLKFPKFHPAARVDFVNKAIKYAIEHADHIITDSEFVKNEIIDFFGTEKHKVTAISLAADASFYPRQAAECEDIAKEYGLAYKEFFLFISTLEPRKNLLILLDAFCLYRQKHPSGLPLVIVGGNGWNNKSILRKIKSMEVNGWVKYVGYTRQEVVPQFYSAAKALLFPSIYEGFGLPVLEAMKSAIPVLTSKNSSMSEITLDSALLVDIDDIEGMSLLISELSTNQELCDILSIKGRERAKAFSWERCAKETMDVYRSLSENITYW